MICVWGAKDEEFYFICSGLSAGDKGNKQLRQTSVDDSWMVAHLGKMHVSEAWSFFIYMYIYIVLQFHSCPSVFVLTQSFKVDFT